MICIVPKGPMGEKLNLIGIQTWFVLADGLWAYKSGWSRVGLKSVPKWKPLWIKKAGRLNKSEHKAEISQGVMSTGIVQDYSYLTQPHLTVLMYKESRKERSKSLST